MIERPNWEDEPVPLRSLLPRNEDPGLVIHDATVVAQAAVSVNRDAIEQFGKEVEGLKNPFIRLQVGRTGESILLYRNPQILSQREDTVTKRKKTEIKQLYTLGFVGLSPYGVFVIKFRETEMSAQQIELLKATDSPFPGLDDTDLSNLGRVLRDFNQKTGRSTSSTLYLVAQEFQATESGTVPKLTIYENVPMDTDPIQCVFGAMAYPGGTQVSSFQTPEGIAIWDKILTDHVSKLSQRTQMTLEIIDQNEKRLDPSHKKE